ncbi:hypothetical protein C8R45DRAFT_1088110 [Mycena sanguinolenta]|nr:hypothetical protein C8R45DRAFT_1088110 [Mycena sanguinolenta]
MAGEAMRGVVFHGVVYYIDPRSNDRDLIRLLLDSNGGKEANSAQKATRLIVEPHHFASFNQIKWSAHGAYSPIVVTPEWVYSSVKCGVKRPSQSYSADPALFLSSIVVSASALPAIHTNFLRDSVTKYGGQWLPTPTDDVTHLVVDPIVIERGDDSPGPITSVDWVIHSLAQETLLPMGPYEFKLQPGKETVSAARRFCESLSFSHHEDDELNAKTSIISVGPIPSLPAEILGKIFVDFRDEALCASSPSLTRDVLTVSHICSHWRSVAHITTELWTHLHLQFHSEWDYRAILKPVKEWFARSQPRALSLRIRSCCPGSKNPIISFLLTHASRIRELSLELPPAHFIPFLRAPAGSFPLLENLTMWVASQAYRPWDPCLSENEYFDEAFEDPGPAAIDEMTLWEHLTPTTSLRDAPRLQKMKLRAASPLSLSLRVLPVGWGTLTELDFVCVTLDNFDAACLLRECTRLERINFMTENTFDPDPDMSPLPCVRLPHLTVVRWSAWSDNASSSVFDGLILPRLETLTLRDGSETFLRRMYTTSPFALRELSLSSTTFAFLSTFLPAMPSLVSFSASLSTTDEFLVFLTNDEQQRHLVLPNLENLDVRHFDKHFSASAVLSMLESRWRTTPLARVKLDTSGSGPRVPAPVHLRDRLIELVEEGLKLEYNCDRGDRASGEAS